MAGRKVKAAAVYCRISDDKKGEALGVQRQEEMCRKLAAEKGWPVAEVYIDNDVSAFWGKARPAYEQMLADLEGGARDAVIVVDQDRLTRHTRELEEFIDAADRLKVPLASVSGEVDLGSSDGRFRARIMGAVARQEGERKSERIARQRDQAAQLGKPAGGPRPFGYEQDHLTVRESEAVAVRDAVRRVLSGESFRSVAQRWNAEGLLTARGNEWSTNSVRVVLTGPRIAGLRRHRGEVVGEAAWPAIIDRAEHEQLVALTKARRRPSGRPAAHLLSGIAVCGRCGETMLTGYHTAGKRQYRCLKSPGEHRGCGRMAVVADPVDELLRDLVIEAVAGPELASRLAAASGGDDESRRVADELGEAERRMEQLAADHYGDGVLTRAEFMAARKRLEERIADLHSTLSRTAGRSVLADVPADPEALLRRWEDEGLEWRREMVRAVVDDVTIHPATSSRPRFDPDRVNVSWRG